MHISLEAFQLATELHVNTDLGGSSTLMAPKALGEGVCDLSQRKSGHTKKRGGPGPSQKIPHFKTGLRNCCP